jgi:hypothetical protein
MDYVYIYNNTQINMRAKLNALELLQAKVRYNRMSRQLAWSHHDNVERIIKSDRLRFDYSDPNNEKRRSLCDRLKNCF